MYSVAIMMAATTTSQGVSSGLKIKSENELPNAMDKCVADAIVKTGR